MDIQINIEYGPEELGGFLLEELAQFVLESEEKPQNTEVSLSFVSDERITELNERFRHKSGPTDVLSFECDGVVDDMEESSISVDAFLLGDVIIASDVAMRQSKEYQTTFEEEVSLLLVHGLLHLCGYDHMDEKEAEVMELREAELLSEWECR